MKITIKATPEELAKLLQAIASSKEQTKRKHPESKIEYDPQTGEGTLKKTESKEKFVGGFTIAGKPV
ncbi:hypothetical protein IR166_04690 [Enterococcus faecalis]|uniref:hypothetical protein n=1 Tax=Enterococcus gallinarum TaxID=1353 RepID=UPI0010733FC8|nr:hypothetical protein [Enterococcus gallinarum]MBF0820942.1 hypothetical protein [Enterococcus faecalis]MBF0724967.1 hypothetical protein [Enterococcus gallinarum]MBF0796235.1 hypothetical protein [Enterococcus gallinarum]MBX8979514.1 hypothetical protein [Enterococcus gallinarum]NYS81068.1 hypothetical protein [Enterococcus gallinarum]